MQVILLLREEVGKGWFFQDHSTAVPAGDRRNTRYGDDVGQRLYRPGFLQFRRAGDQGGFDFVFAQGEAVAILK